MTDLITRLRRDKWQDSEELERLRDENERLRATVDRISAFTTHGNRRTLGISKVQLSHIRWAIAKGLCNVELAADKLGFDRDGLRSALGGLKETP